MRYLRAVVLTASPSLRAVYYLRGRADWDIFASLNAVLTGVLFASLNGVYVESGAKFVGRGVVGDMGIVSRRK